MTNLKSLAITIAFSTLSLTPAYAEQWPETSSHCQSGYWQGLDIDGVPAVICREEFSSITDSGAFYQDGDEVLIVHEDMTWVIYDTNTQDDLLQGTHASWNQGTSQ